MTFEKRGITAGALCVNSEHKIQQKRAQQHSASHKKHLDRFLKTQIKPLKVRNQKQMLEGGYQ